MQELLSTVKARPITDLSSLKVGDIIISRHGLGYAVLEAHKNFVLIRPIFARHIWRWCFGEDDLKAIPYYLATRNEAAEMMMLRRRAGIARR